MQLTFESQILNNVAVLRCRGRITYGPEVEALEEEVERQTKIEGTSVFRVKQVVLQMGGIDFIDSSGLGALVRIYSLLQAAGGGLKLCQVSGKVLRVIEMTHLGTLFPAYASETEAIEAFSSGENTGTEEPESLKTRIVCVDPSKDVLAGLKALLTTAGYEVLTSRYMGEASTLTRATKPKVLICGPGLTAMPIAAETIDALHRSDGRLSILRLPADFHILDAGRAGEDLLSQLQALTSS